MTNYFYKLDLDYLDPLLKVGKFNLVFTRKNSYIELRITESGKFVACIIGNSISHTLKRANAFLRDRSKAMPIVSEYVSTNLDNLIIASDYSIEIVNIDNPIFTAFLYDANKKNVFSAIDFEFCNTLVKLEDFVA